MKISLGFSPCPNDTFIFDALVNEGFDTNNLSFNLHLEDVQTLNQWALEARLDVTKISYGVWPLVRAQYDLLESGGALGTGVGPLLISNTENFTTHPNDITVAIPGENTTAHLLFSLAYPHASKKIFLRFDEIETFVQKGKGLGVIIHENRFTYLKKDLKKIIDLGDYWESQTGLPIPLGCIVAKKGLGKNLILQLEGMIRKSIEISFRRYPVLSAFIRDHAQEMDEEVMRKHINLYVNDYSLTLGDAGHKAVQKLEDIFLKLNQSKK